MNNKRLIFILKACVSVSLIILLLHKAGVKKVFAAFSGVQPVYLLSAALLVCAGVIVKSYKLQILLRMQGLRFSLARLVNLYLVGKFFNNFLPTTIGGDLVKFLAISGHSKTRVQPLSAVFMDRLTGFITLAALALAVFCFSPRLTDYSIAFPMACFFLSAVLMAVFSWSDRSLSVAKALTRFLKGGGGLADKFAKIHYSLKVYRNDIGGGVLIILLSLLFHVIDILITAFVARALGVSVPLYYFFLAVPIINAVVTLPVSLNGIGIREGAFVFFFSKLGIPQAEIIALSLLLYAFIVFFSLAGGASYLIRGRAF